MGTYCLPWLRLRARRAAASAVPDAITKTDWGPKVAQLSPKIVEPTIRPRSSKVP